MITFNSSISQKLLDIFFSNEGQAFYLNEIVRKLQADKRNVAKKLKEFETEGLLKAEPRGNMKFYSINKDFGFYEEYKKLTLKTFGFDKKIQNVLKQISGISRAFIYGSYATNSMDTSSDIDIMIIGSHKVVEAQKAIAKLQKEYDREMNVINMSDEEFARKQVDSFIAQILKEAKVELI